MQSRQVGGAHVRGARVAGARGFTLIESMVVLLFVALLVTIGLPALQQMIHRSRLEGATRECAVMCQRSRLESIRQGMPVVVRFDTKDRTVASWIDANGDGVQDPTETEIMVISLPGAVRFEGPPGLNPIEGFTTDPDGGWVTFQTDGSIDFEGEVHFMDERSNYLQLSLEPRATANVQVTKWDGTKWVSPGEGGKPWKWN